MQPGLSQWELPILDEGALGAGGIHCNCCTVPSPMGRFVFADFANLVILRLNLFLFFSSQVRGIGEEGEQILFLANISCMKKDGTSTNWNHQYISHDILMWSLQEV